MPNGLLERQRSLLEYLTSDETIFGEARMGPLNSNLGGIGVGPLRHEARFSFGKRIGKIRAVLPLTFAIIDEYGSDLLRAFAQECPPTEISQLGNAQQFCSFVNARSQYAPIVPPHLVDVASCELACARMRLGSSERTQTPGTNGACKGVRRHPGAVFLRCAYDIRPLFEAAGAAIIPARRDTFIAVSIPATGSVAAHVFEMTGPLFDVLAACETWTDPGVFGTTKRPDELIRDLTEAGLVEVM